MAMTYRVEIDQCFCQFSNAQHILMEDLGGAAYVIQQYNQVDDFLDFLKEAWKTKYGITPCSGNFSKSWIYLDFTSKKHYTAFILTWS